MEAGVALYQGLTTPAVFWPLVLSVRARGFALGDRPADGLRLIEEAMQGAGEEAVINPGFGVLRAELLLALGDAQAAVTQLRDVLDLAGRFGLRMPGLLAATMLARLERAEGAKVLRSVYDSFTEGLDDPELVDARAVLAEVDVAVG